VKKACENSPIDPEKTAVLTSIQGRDFYRN
jgi:hypothetical protein